MDNKVNHIDSHESDTSTEILKLEESTAAEFLNPPPRSFQDCVPETQQADQAESQSHSPRGIMAKTQFQTGKRKRVDTNEEFGKKVVFEPESQTRYISEIEDVGQIHGLASLHQKYEVIQQENLELHDKVRELRQQITTIVSTQKRIERELQMKEEVLEGKFRVWLMESRKSDYEFMVDEISKHLTGMADIVVTGHVRLQRSRV